MGLSSDTRVMTRVLMDTFGHLEGGGCRRHNYLRTSSHWYRGREETVRTTESDAAMDEAEQLI